MNLPKAEIIPDDPEKLPPARRRRARRLLAPLDVDERAAFVDEIAHRASPNFDFFLFSLLSGIVLAVAVWLDQAALLFLGALLAPLMAPVVGLALGTVLGSIRFFLRSLVGLLIGSVLVLLAGVLVGFMVRENPLTGLDLATNYAQLSWINFFILAVGAVFTSASMLRSGERTAAASVALAFGLYNPLVVAGFGLGSGISHLWPDGLAIYTIHLAWGALLGAATLVLLGYRPLTLYGYTFGGVLTLLGVILFMGLGGTGAVLGGQMALPTPIPTATLTITPTLTETLTPKPPTLTPTHTQTQTLTPSPTVTLTPTPTPVFAVIQTEDGNGALMRDEPGGTVVGSYVDGTILQLLPGVIEQNGVAWVRVIAPDGTNGWIFQELLVIATPAPNW
jgi:hypothetical protein